MGCFDGPKTTTTTNQNTNQQQQSSGVSGGTSTMTPNMPDWYAQFLQSIPGMYKGPMDSLTQMANKPLYGNQQTANYQQGLNQQLGNASQTINSQLASHGALNSNRAAQAQTGLALGGAQQMGNYLAQVPLLNAQNKQSVLGQQGNMLANLQNFKIPIGQSMDQASFQSAMDNINSQMNGTQTSQQSGGLLQSLLGGLMGAGMSALGGGMSNLFGGGGVSQPADTRGINASSLAPGAGIVPTQYNYQPPPYQPFSNTFGVQG